MSTLNPIRIDRYVLYLDSLVMIAIDEQQPEFYRLTFSNGEWIHLLRSHESDLQTLLPANFLSYEQRWINDNFIMNFDLTWDKTLKRLVLITKIRGMGEVREYGAENILNALIDARVLQSTNALLSNDDEITQSVTTAATPVVQQIVQPIVEQTVTQTVAPIVEQQVAEQVNVGDMGQFFNSQLNQ